MAPAKPMLDGVELPQTQRIASEDEEVLAQHGVPALEGDFLQDLGRRAVRVTLSGVLSGAEAGEGLKGLREKFHAAAPVPFVSDIATTTRVDKVLIEEMGVRELAGKPERFEYAFALREYTPLPAVTEEVPPVIPVPPVPWTSRLVVTVTVEGEPDFDFGRVTVTASGTDAEGTGVSRTLASRTGNVWTEEDFPPGRYTLEAAVAEPDAMTGSTEVEVRPGETAEAEIVLRRDVRTAKAFVIHFWFDKAFVEPCLRQVLQRVIAYSDAHPDEKVLIVGHTDLTGADAYNQSLSERRARSVHAFLTFGRDRTGAVAEWNELRRTRPSGQITTVRDTWDTREAQYMLQDLGRYLGNIDEDPGPLTQAAIRGFQTDNGLAPTGIMDDATWEKLVEAYLEQDSFALPEERFFRNAQGACNSGVLKWIGCGETDPVLNTELAWRPNRRTEILFFHTDTLPAGDIPEPDTFDLPTPGAVGPSWCLGPRNRNLPRCPFTTRRQPAPPGKFLIRPAEPGKVQVSGTITFEDGTPVANAKYSLTAPDGEYLNTAAADANPSLEEKQADPAPNLPPRRKQKGRPIPNRADVQGRFSFQRETPEGVYILELQELTTPQVARSTEDPPGSGIGNVVCFRLDAAPPAGQETAAFAAAAPVPAAAPATGKGGVVQSAPAPAAPVNPTITPADPVVVVKRSYTSPARVPITLSASGRVRRNGTLTRSGDTAAVRLFTTRTGNTEFTFNAANEATVTSGRLNQRGGFTLFAESDTPTGSVGGYHLTLALAPGSTPVGPPAVANITAVRVTLDLFTPREPSGTNPQALPQPPAPAPPAATATDKWFGGGLVNFQDAAHTQERVKLRVGLVEPNDFVGTLTLRQVAVRGNDVGAAVSRVQGFDSATTSPGEAPVGNTIPVNGLGFTGQDIFLEGTAVSGARRDTGFQLGVQGASEDGDRVSLTVGVGAAVIPASALRAVLVKKPHTSPARQAITLRVTAPLPSSRRGTLTAIATSGAIQLFKADGTVITNTGNNVFPGDQLTNGVQILAEGSSPCASLNDIQLVLTLSAGSPPAGIPGSVRLTSVEVTLDVGLIRTAPNVDPAPMPAADKINIGRFVQVALPNRSHERAMLFVRPPSPASFACTLVVNPLDARVQLFSQEVPSAGQTPLTTAHTVASVLPSVVPGGVRLFAEGAALSAAGRDTGFRLGIQGLDDDGDRVPISVIDLALTDNATPVSSVIDRVQIEGILNSDRSSFDVGDPFGTQLASLFHVRVDLLGFTGAVAKTRLISTRADGTILGTLDLDLTRKTGDRFGSPLPILIVPEVTAAIGFSVPKNVEAIRGSAGGRLTLRMTDPSGASRRAPVRGRVVRIQSHALVGSLVARARMEAEIRLANVIWSQAGIEVLARHIDDAVADPGELLDLDGFDLNPFLGVLTPEEETLLGLDRSVVRSDINVYYVRSIDNGLTGEGISSQEFATVTDPRDSGVILAAASVDSTLAHEMGHLMIQDGDEHSVAGVDRPATNVMHRFDNLVRRDLDQGQVSRAIRAGNPFVRFVE